MRRVGLALVLVCAAALFLAPSAADGPSRTYLPLVISPKAPTPTPSCPVRDTFDAPPGWPEYEDDDYRLAYVDGEYRFFAKTPWMGVALYSGLHCPDCAIEVQGRLASAAAGEYGLIFGITEDYQGYGFMVDSAQRYALLKSTTEGDETLAPWTFSAALNPGQGTNVLGVARQGETILLYANGTLLQAVSDSAFTGDLGIGLWARAYDEPGVDVRFDNLLACVP